MDPEQQQQQPILVPVEEIIPADPTSPSTPPTLVHAVRPDLTRDEQRQLASPLSLRPQEAQVVLGRRPETPSDPYATAQVGVQPPAFAPETGRMSTNAYNYYKGSVHTGILDLDQYQRAAREAAARGVSERDFLDGELSTRPIDVHTLDTLIEAVGVFMKPPRYPSRYIHREEDPRSHIPTPFEIFTTQMEEYKSDPDINLYYRHGIDIQYILQCAIDKSWYGFPSNRHFLHPLQSSSMRDDRAALEMSGTYFPGWIPELTRQYSGPKIRNVTIKLLFPQLGIKADGNFIPELSEYSDYLKLVLMSEWAGIRRLPVEERIERENHLEGIPYDSDFELFHPITQRIETEHDPGCGAGGCELMGGGGLRRKYRSKKRRSKRKKSSRRKQHRSRRKSTQRKHRSKRKKSTRRKRRSRRRSRRRSY